MAKDLISGLSTIGTTKIKKRKNITIKLYDKNNLPTTNPVLAYKTFILIYNDVTSVDISKDFDKPVGEDKKAMSVYGYEVESEGIFKNIVLEEAESLNSAIIPNLYEMTFLDLTIQGTEGDTNIDSTLMGTILQKFSCININNKSFSSIFLPTGDIELESFAVSGGNIEMTGGISITADASISIESVKIYTKNEDKMSLNLICKNTNVYDISVDSYLSIKVIGVKPSTTNEYMEGEVSFNNITYNLTDEIEKGYPEVKPDPLIDISNVYKVRMSDIYIYGAQTYKGIKLSKIGSVMICGLDRISEKGIYGYTLGLSDIMNTYISKFTVSAGLKIEREVYALFIADDGLAYNQKLVVSDFDISNIRLINLGYSKADSISFSNGIVNTNHLLEAKETNSTRSIKFSNCEFVITEPIMMYVNNLNINDSKIKLLNSDKDANSHYIHVDGSLVFDTTLLYGEIPFKFETGTEAYIRFKDSDVSMNKLHFKYDAEENADVEQLSVIDESNRVLYFSSTNVVSDEFTVDNLYRLSTEKMSLNCDKVNLKNTKAELNTIVINKPSAIKYTFEEVTFKNATVETRNSHSSKINAISCSGTLTYNVNDTITEEPTIKLDVMLKDSKFNLKIDSQGASVNTLINSDNSLGSTIFGVNKLSTVTPSMKSGDLSSFNQISEFKDKKSDSVNYGNSEEELSPYSLYGLKT